MGIPIPERMTRIEIAQAEAFSLAIWGAPMFDPEPSHNGRHGYGCEFCLGTLRARDEERDRKRAITQPWQTAA